MTLIIIIVLVLLFAGYGASPANTYGAYGWSPIGLLVLVVLILALTGRLRF